MGKPSRFVPPLSLYGDDYPEDTEPCMESFVHRLDCGHLVLVDDIEPCALNCRQPWGSQRGTFRCLHCTKANLDAQCEHAITRLKIEAYRRGSLGATGKDLLRQDIDEIKAAKYEGIRSRMQDPEARRSLTLKRSTEIYDLADLMTGIELDTQSHEVDLDRYEDVESRGRTKQKGAVQRERSRSPITARHVTGSNGAYRDRSPLGAHKKASFDYPRSLTLRPGAQHRTSASVGKLSASRARFDTTSSSIPSVVPIQPTVIPGLTLLHLDIAGGVDTEMGELDRKMQELGMSTPVGTPKSLPSRTRLTMAGSSYAKAGLVPRIVALKAAGISPLPTRKQDSSSG
ncbi:hypothetical protein LTS18_002303 [Coniosporium uncinatum]|uniref:Uncharacterized protein n=1 Tax=Coniosporium uncinatum TaxID=93489 RepID=A0ACC3DUH8_9PEZI|nr:hypothetical protein LTS18_002303 [Coniosporium uncinatum]